MAVQILLFALCQSCTFVGVWRENCGQITVCNITADLTIGFDLRENFARFSVRALDPRAAADLARLLISYEADLTPLLTFAALK